MKLIDPSYEIIRQEDGLQGVYKQIELAGRTCYKSEDKITAESAEAFVQRMIDSGHTAMLEHGTVYFYIKRTGDGGINPNDPFEIDFDTIFCKYGQHNTNYETHETFFTTNLRWLVEKYPEDWKSILEYYWHEPDARWPKRRTVRMTTSLHVYKDLTRHRSMSFAIESTRFCNYSKGKFGSELTFIRPCWCKYISIGGAYWHDGICFRTGANEENANMGDRSWNGPKEGDDPKEWYAEEAFLSAAWEAEKSYMKTIQNGWQAQQAAEVLPQWIKADMIMTGFESDWDHTFNLRSIGTTGKPHPEVERIITPIFKEFQQYGYTKLISSGSSSNSNSTNF